ncbi:MAG TPA: FAD-dependent monooxygenase [Candidatus Acidoferrales bacterium]|nr:FAD-dependent monooxygenase [Candidatus Acidoferrales bacterium]
MRIIVIGAGIGGLTAALTLRRSGFEVQVFEQATELREVGAGVQISPNATRILHRLGLEQPLRRFGVRPHASVIRRWDDGRVIARQPLADACERNFGAPYYHFHRAELLDVLAAAVPKNVLHLDHRCVGLTQHADRVEVQFENGATADADVVIGADGIHSAVRAAILGPESPRFSGHVVYRGLVPAMRVAHLGIEVAASSWWGPNHHFVQYFVGADARYLNWVAVTPGEWRLESWTAKGEVADALKEFEGWHPQVRTLIRSVDATNRWALYDRDPLPRWSVGRVTLMGDAAHPMLPYMAQGAVQSIEDAAVLAKCLEQADTHDVETALRRYEETRKPRATRCQEGSRRNAVMYHLPDGDEQRHRDANLASAADAPLPQNAWLYGHDVEAEFVNG